MEFEQIHREFLTLEDNLDLFKIKIDDIPVWERIRFSVHRALMYDLNQWSTEEPEPSPGLRLYSKKMALWGRNIALRNPFFADQHEILYWGHHRRKKRSDGYWWDIYTDPIHAELDQDYLQVEAPHFTEHHTPSKTANLRYIDLIRISAGIARKLGLIDISLPMAERRQLQAAEERISEVFGAQVDILSLVQEHLRDRQALKPLYRRFLERVNPEVVVVVVHNGKETFIETCHELGITVVELQQAILNKYEYAYSFPGNRTKVAFPDYYFSWGEFWNEQVAFPIPDEHVITVGYPYLEQTKREYDAIQQDGQVLFISQPNIGNQLSSVAAELATDPEVSTDVVYKLHPHEYEDWRSEYPDLINTDLEVIDGDGRPLYQLFAESTAQVGVFSTALYEGLNFELSTYLMEFPGVEQLANLYEENSVTLVGSSEELKTALNRPNSQPVDPTRFFEPNTAETLETAFKAAIRH